MFLGRGQEVIAAIFIEFVETPSAEIKCPKYSTLETPKWHLLSLANKVIALRISNIFLTLLRWVSQSLLKTKISSKKKSMNCHRNGQKISFIKLQKEEGAFLSPKVVTAIMGTKCSCVNIKRIHSDLVITRSKINFRIYTRTMQFI